MFEGELGGCVKQTSNVRTARAMTLHGEERA